MKVRHRDRGGRPPIADETQRVEALLTREQVAALDVLAEMEETSRADLIRDAVDLLLTTPKENA